MLKTDNLRYSDISRCPLDAEWQQRAAEELNETPEVLERELRALKQLVENDTNLSVPEGDDFLVRFLRARKYRGTF
ncbi:unnamed protein product [Callosobruchus maculatus]|uniref:CRAL/TRIO N-terminal domain-containing protein n=1 Tax=Callosobruchus maculatus TaxID=64391 RepID=A0A653CB56_CALMS|nr:unnamed protein product [Callosobruchus maculatus]